MCNLPDFEQQVTKTVCAIGGLNNKMEGDAENFFGEGVEIIADDDVLPEHTFAPLVQPAAPAALRQLLKARETPSFVEFLTTTPSRQRNVAVLGSLHSGKTSLVDALAHSRFAEEEEERDRAITSRNRIATFVIEGSTSTPSVLATVIDTPGHPDFLDDVAGATRLADAAVLCVDAAEGVTRHTLRLVELCCDEALPIALAITKMDRLFLDLRLPPSDAYHKVRAIVDSINVALTARGRPGLLPQQQRGGGQQEGGVLFVSSRMDFCFTLHSVATVYAKRFGPDVGVDWLAARLWGDIGYDESVRAFVAARENGLAPSFVSFVLEPLYKVVAHALAGSDLPMEAETAGLTVSSSAAKMTPSLAGGGGAPNSIRDAVRRACSSLYGPCTVHAGAAIVAVTPSPTARQMDLLKMYHCTPPAAAAPASDDSVCVVVSMHRLLPSLTAASGYEVCAIGRVVGGSLSAGDAIEVVHSEFEAQLGSASSVFIRGADGTKTVLRSAPAGMIVWISGLADAFVKQGVIVTPGRPIASTARVCPLKCPEPFVCVALEPANPKDSRVFAEHLANVTKLYGGSRLVSSNTSDEAVVVGYGELYLDCLLHDLRAVFCSKFRIKVSAPFVEFRESVEAKNGLLCAYPPDAGPGMFQLQVTANRLEDGVSSDIETGLLAFDTPAAKAKAAQTLRSAHSWDLLQSRGVVAFGPSNSGCSANVLIDDLLDNARSGAASPEAWAPIVEGFRRAVLTGPICASPVTGVRFMVTEVAGALKNGGNINRSQIAAICARACTEALLGAHPCLLEPVYAIEVIAPVTRLDTVQDLLALRRGSVRAEARLEGTPLCRVHAFIPVIESFGFESELRMRTCGEAFPYFFFSHWSPVPGDPCDTSVVLRPLQAAEGFQLARDFALKHRRRRGLTSQLEL